MAGTNTAKRGRCKELGGAERRNGTPGSTKPKKAGKVAQADEVPRGRRGSDSQSLEPIVTGPGSSPINADRKTGGETGQSEISTPKNGRDLPLQASNNVAWKQMPAEFLHDLESLDTALEFVEGTLRNQFSAIRIVTAALRHQITESDFLRLDTGGK
ncbi:hypothetical protein PMIN04_013209 [Paraphaeosphaeria minitans]|uniref:Uncharacterized protein n=1 Tax=Paraphaeosphaeria minitans TaxID=565426 RepID=A0A9P6G877_9PLEO|nr:hypothetical protein PMIN01_12236 [Paraphaeosphaeria minitans]